MIEVKVMGFAIDKQQNTPILILEEIEGNKRILPIWIGECEADAISRGLTKAEIPRPFTHDLIISIIKGLRAELIKVEITQLKNNTFYALLWLKRESDIIKIDARPSDAVAIAVHTGIPIFVSDEIMSKEGIKYEKDKEHKLENIKEYLKKVKPENFGEIDLR